VSVRVSPTEKIRGEIDALFDGSRELSEIIEDVARLGARLIIQAAAEGRGRCVLGPGPLPAPETPGCTSYACPTYGHPSRGSSSPTR
jgi:hypothetical protein